MLFILTNQGKRHFTVYTFQYFITGMCIQIKVFNKKNLKTQYPPPPNKQKVSVTCNYGFPGTISQAGFLMKWVYWVETPMSQLNSR